MSHHTSMADNLEQHDISPMLNTFFGLDSLQYYDITLTGSLENLDQLISSL